MDKCYNRHFDHDDDKNNGQWTGVQPMMMMIRWQIITGNGNITHQVLRRDVELQLQQCEQVDGCHVSCLSNRDCQWVQMIVNDIAADICF